jgi:hypothetical protein
MPVDLWPTVLQVVGEQLAQSRDPPTPALFEARWRTLTAGAPVSDHGMRFCPTTGLPRAAVRSTRSRADAYG